MNLTRKFKVADVVGSRQYCILAIAHTGWADETRARMHTHFWGSFDSRMKVEGDKDKMTTVLSIDRHKEVDSTGTGRSL